VQWSAQFAFPTGPYDNVDNAIRMAYVPGNGGYDFQVTSPFVTAFPTPGANTIPAFIVNGNFYSFCPFYVYKGPVAKLAQFAVYINTADVLSFSTTLTYKFEVWLVLGSAISTTSAYEQMGSGTLSLPSAASFTGALVTSLSVNTVNDGDSFFLVMYRTDSGTSTLADIYFTANATFELF
jgi:hypothetical protein